MDLKTNAQVLRFAQDDNLKTIPMKLWDATLVVLGGLGFEEAA